MSKSVKLAAAVAAVSVALAPVATAQPADVTYCPSNGTWGAEYEYCPPTWTVDGIYRPQCYLEDGSDSNILPCVWFDPDTGDGYLTFATYSRRIFPL